MSNGKFAQIRFPILAACVLAAGGAAVPGASAAPTAGGSQFDGLYAGDNSLSRGFGFICGPAAYPQSVTVHDGSFDYPYAINSWQAAPVPVQIAPDGSLSGKVQVGTFDTSRRDDFRTGWVTVSGQISGTTLDVTVSDMRCTRHLALQRR